MYSYINIVILVIIVSTLGEPEQTEFTINKQIKQIFTLSFTI